LPPLHHSTPLPIGNRRYSRLKICATLNRYAPQAGMKGRRWRRDILAEGHSSSPSSSAQWSSLDFPRWLLVAQGLDGVVLGGFEGGDAAGQNGNEGAEEKGQPRGVEGDDRSVLGGGLKGDEFHQAVGGEQSDDAAEDGDDDALDDDLDEDTGVAGAD